MTGVGMNKKLTISLVTWNGEKYLPLLFSSLQKQTFQDFDLVILDNGSSDSTTNVILSEAKDLDSSGKPQNDSRVRIIKKKKNIGFASAHNEIFEKSDSDYFLVLNQDIFLKEDALEKLVKFLDENKGVASVAPILNKWVNPSVIPAQAGIQEVDSLGLKVLRNRRVVENKETPQQVRDSNVVEVFGISGACAMYYREAVEEVGGLFDGDYLAYKEDVDVSFRLRQGGLKSCVLLSAQAWHDRTGSEKSKKDSEQAENKKKQSDLVKYQSYRNHLITIYKNEYWQNFTIDFPFILWYELKKFLWFLIFDREVLKGLLEIWKMRKELKMKRRAIIKTRKLNWKQMRKVFTL